MHSIDTPGDFLSLFYKDTLLILKPTKDKNKNGTSSVDYENEI